MATQYDLWEAAAWIIVLLVLATATAQGNGFSTTTRECVAYGSLLGLAVCCAYLGIDDDADEEARDDVKRD